MKIIAVFIAFVALAPAACAETPIKTVAPAEAMNYYGRSISVKSVISADTTSARGNRFLNMGGAYPNQAFTGWIPTKNANAFSVLPNVTGRTCIITGQVQPYKGKPEIILDSPSQVRCE